MKLPLYIAESNTLGRLPFKHVIRHDDWGFICARKAAGSIFGDTLL
jgi:hypothetical protein